VRGGTIRKLFESIVRRAGLRIISSSLGAVAVFALAASASLLSSDRGDDSTVVREEVLPDSSTATQIPPTRKVPIDLLLQPLEPLVWTCGDVDHSGHVNVGDVWYLIRYVDRNGPKPIPPEAGDADCNGVIDEADILYMLDYVFAGGPEPCAECPRE
jgi:hypothetical protein